MRALTAPEIVANPLQLAAWLLRQPVRIYQCYIRWYHCRPLTDTCSLNILVVVLTLKICMAHYSQTVSMQWYWLLLQTSANALYNAFIANPSFKWVLNWSFIYLLYFRHWCAVDFFFWQQLGFLSISLKEVHTLIAGVSPVRASLVVGAWSGMLWVGMEY